MEGQAMNMNRGLMGTDSKGIDCRSWGDRVGISNGGKGRITVTEQ